MMNWEQDVWVHGKPSRSWWKEYIRRFGWHLENWAIKLQNWAR
jgi:hypothetical protein